MKKNENQMKTLKGYQNTLAQEGVLHKNKCAKIAIIKRIRNDKDIFQKYWHNKIKIIMNNDKT